jgi:hypothetical protein
VNLRYAFQDDENCFFVLDLMLGGDLRCMCSKIASTTPEMGSYLRNSGSPFGENGFILRGCRPFLHCRGRLCASVPSRKEDNTPVRHTAVSLIQPSAHSISHALPHPTLKPCTSFVFVGIVARALRDPGCFGCSWRI